MDAPTGVAASDGTYSNKISVAWNTVSGALYYELWRNTSNNTASASVLAQTTNSAAYDDQAVTEGVTYYYWVKAKNSQTNSGFSSPDSGYISYAPPTPAGNADLYLSDLVFLPTTLTNLQNPGAVAATLFNQGPDNMVSPNTYVKLDLYLSANANFGDGDDISLGDYTYDQTLYAGSYVSLVVPASGRSGLVVPGAVTGGTYNVFARVRHAYPSGLVDSDESNNYTMRSSPVTIYVYDTNNPVPPPNTGYHLINDYDGDGKSDIALYKESTGDWLLILSASGYSTTGFILGGAGYKPVLADYDGDGKSDPAVCKKSTGDWKIMLSGSGYQVTSLAFGETGCTPVPMDYDGDGKGDPTIYRESAGTWEIMRSADNYASLVMALGGNGRTPAPGDYDGDGISDVAVYRDSTGDWAAMFSSLDYWVIEFNFGGHGTTPVPADYDGDGKTDPGVYKESSGEWTVMMSRYNYLTAGATFGGQGWVPVPGVDYDGDGKADVAIYNDGQHLLKVLLSGSNYSLMTVEVGGPGYEPVGSPQ